MGFLKIIQNIAVESLFHHLAHPLAALGVGDVDKVNARRPSAEVDCQKFFHGVDMFICIFYLSSKAQI